MSPRRLPENGACMHAKLLQLCPTLCDPIGLEKEMFIEEWNTKLTVISIMEA